MNQQDSRRPELLSLLKSAISFKSTVELPNEKQECIDWAEASFFGNLLQSAVRGSFEGSPWVYVPAEDARLLVFAHLDVVPASDAMFSLRVEGDRALGRGVSDMKGCVLPFLMAYRDAIAEGETPPVSVLLTTDEEVAGGTIPHLLGEGIVRAKAAFTPDTHDLGIVCEHKGILWGELVASGKGGHGAYPWKAKNPVWLLAKALKILEQKFPPGNEDDWQMTVSPTVLRGSAARNQIADRASCGIDIRYVPEEHASAEAALAAVAAVLPEGCSLTEVRSASPLKTSESDPAVLLYKGVAERVLGRPIPFRREHGGTDARYFGEYGIPAFLYGPEGGGIHSEEEWVSIPSLLRHYEIYRELFTVL